MVSCIACFWFIENDLMHSLFWGLLSHVDSIAEVRPKKTVGQKLDANRSAILVPKKTILSTSRLFIEELLAHPSKNATLAAPSLPVHQIRLQEEGKAL